MPQINQSRVVPGTGQVVYLQPPNTTTTGAAGPQPQRLQGDMGPIGPTGPQGLQGLQGPQGVPGPAAPPNGFANVMAYGAIGDGVNDDTPAIRAAIAALNALPGTVYFPPGHYKVTGAHIVLPSSTRITGAGPAQSILVSYDIGYTAFYGAGTIFTNTVSDAIGTGPVPLPVSAHQTDHDIQIDNLGFDMSHNVRGIACGAFSLVRNITIHDVIADRQPQTTSGYSGFKIIGCDNVAFSNYRARNVTNAVDCWTGTTRVKVSDVVFESCITAGNGGLINFNGIGSQSTTPNPFCHSIDLQVSDATFFLYQNAHALFLDGLGPGSSCQDMLVSNVVISARTGTNNAGIICRGWVNRLKVCNVSFDAQPGADMNPFLVGGFFSPTKGLHASNVITTTNGSNQIVVTWPGGARLGPGNYMSIVNDATGQVLSGNGLNIKGYYPITAISGPITTTTCGDTFTVTIPGQVATTTGTMPGAAAILGYYGQPEACDFQAITLDGISAAKGDLVAISGTGCRISGVTVTTNYNGYATPQYRSIVAAHDGELPQDKQPQNPHNVSDLVGAPGTQPLQAGWLGDNTVTYGIYGPPPTRTLPQTGTFTPVIYFGAGPSSDIVYSEQSGSYTKTGNLVFFTMSTSASSKGTSIGAATVHGFPFSIGAGGGQARGIYTAGYGGHIAISPSGTTVPIVYSATVGSLIYTIAAGGSGGASGNYPLNYTGGTGTAAGTANFNVIGTDAVASLSITAAGSGGTNGTYPLTFTGDGSGAAGVIVVTNGAITESQLLGGGSGYSMVSVSYSVPGLVGSVVTPTLGIGAVTSISVQTRGVYTVAPTVDTNACPGLTGASITVAVNTAGITRPMDIVGRIGNGVMSLALDVDQSGMLLTSTEFGPFWFLRMTGWYFST